MNGPDFSSVTGGSFSFTVTCAVTVSDANPTVRLFMNLPSVFNGGGTWDLNMLNTVTLSLGDLGGRTVYSASGVLPGTAPATSVPEPGTLALVVGALAAVAMRGRRRRDGGRA